MPSDELVPAIQTMLEDTFQLSGWTIVRPAEGKQKDCYIARAAHVAVFLKFDGNTPIELLQRLGELGVAPHLVGAGLIAGRSYVLQEYVVGKHPQWTWFADHLPLLAHCTLAYHTDAQLKQLLVGSKPVDYREQVTQELSLLDSHMTGLQIDARLAAELSRVFAELSSQANELHAVPLAPVHNDPNGANIWLLDDHMVLVDWDDLLLSDPMRDVSQWLGWYVTQDRWPLFFREYGLPFDQPLRTKVYWWSARASFANVLWHVERQYDHEVFLRDTIAALHHAITPHPVFREES